ncbi:phage virion morphogenesis protein [Phaeobacter sp. HF9A]|uniref:phage virion morphogenesis protein n=1 Tax=Phaeobacter sp. HF9A TaxID=2721561 RepID=UPI001430A91C|nr:phage virion morphogenesis protein [Phaeobacter sp. HF9A]NIZ13917.1 phage virion morphogenesis protein [Phaeobacter sp. HF9A]
MYTLSFNEDGFELRLKQLDGRLDDMSPVLQGLGEYLVQSTQDRMLKGQQPDGRPFAPRSETTLAVYAAKGFRFGAQPLNKSGEMRQQLHYQASATGLTWGSNAIQAAVMQFGAAKGTFGTYEGKGFGGTTPTISIPWGDIPARPFLGISDADRGAVNEELEDWLGDAD